MSLSKFIRISCWGCFSFWWEIAKFCKGLAISSDTLSNSEFCNYSFGSTRDFYSSSWESDLICCWIYSFSAFCISISTFLYINSALFNAIFSLIAFLQSNSSLFKYFSNVSCSSLVSIISHITSPKDAISILGVSGTEDTSSVCLSDNALVFLPLT